MRRPGPGLTNLLKAKDRPAPSEPGGLLSNRPVRHLCHIPALTTLLFAAGVAVFFTPAAVLPCKVACPVLLLSLAVFLTRRRELFPFGGAFLFSAAGDAMGAGDLFIPQMSFFALAHIAYVWWFLPRARRPLRGTSLAVIVPLLAFLFAVIVPEAPFPGERIGVAVYGLIIAAMLCSVLQYDGACAAGFRSAALLFVFSDGVIAWSRFIGPVPARTWVVMTTYYLAQYLFFRCVFKAATRS